jgi:hypothetical protein
MKVVTSLALLAVSLCPALLLAQAGGCDAKRQSIEQEITYAQAHGNTSRVQGLQTALAQVKAHCTDASLRSDAQQKVAKAQQKAVARDQELEEAREQGKSADKMADRQRKADEAHAQLQQAMMDAEALH